MIRRFLLALLLAFAPEGAFAAYPGTPPLIVAVGGTGATTFTAHGMLVGEGTAAIVAMAPVADSVFVQGSASSDPTTAGTSSTADSMLGWGAAGSTPAPVSMGSTCSNALTYSTTTHAFACSNPTQFNVVLGPAAGAAFGLAAPGATTGVPLISNGTSANPGFGTAVVAGGGTGATTLTAHGILIGEGTSAVVAMTTVADSVYVQGAATSDPTTAGTSSTADSVLGWAAAASTPAPIALTNCTGGTNALNYATATHTFSCNSISAGSAPNVNVLTAAGPFTLSSTAGVTNISRMGTPAAATYNLPSAVTAGNGFKGCLKDDTTNFQTNNATLASPTSGNVDGVAGATGVILKATRQEQCYISDGTNWFLE